MAIVIARLQPGSGIELSSSQGQGSVHLCTTLGVGGRVTGLARVIVQSRGEFRVECRGECRGEYLGAGVGGLALGNSGVSGSSLGNKKSS